MRQSLVTHRGRLEAHLGEFAAAVRDIEADSDLTEAAKARRIAAKAKEAKQALAEAVARNGGWKNTVETITRELDRPGAAPSELGQVLKELRAGEVRRLFVQMAGGDKLQAFSLLQAGDPEVLDAIATAPEFVKHALLSQDGLAYIAGAQEARRRAKDPARAQLLDDVTAAQEAFEELAEAALAEIDQSLPQPDQLAADAA